MKKIRRRRSEGRSRTEKKTITEIIQQENEKNWKKIMKWVRIVTKKKESWKKWKKGEGGRIEEKRGITGTRTGKKKKLTGKKERMETTREGIRKEDNREVNTEKEEEEEE